MFQGVEWYSENVALFFFKLYSASILYVKGPVAWDFPPPFFFIKSTHLGPPDSYPNFFRIYFQIRGVIRIKVWLPAASCSGESNLFAASCSGESNLAAAFCSGESNLSAALCSGESNLTAAWCSGESNLTAAWCSRESIWQRGVKSENSVRLPRPLKGQSY